MSAIDWFSEKLCNFGLQLAVLAASSFAPIVISAAFCQFYYGNGVFSDDKGTFAHGLYRITNGLELLFMAPIPLLLIRAISKAFNNRDEGDLSKLKVSVSALMSAIIAASLAGTILQTPQEYGVVASKVLALFVTSTYTYLMSLSLRAIHTHPVDHQGQPESNQVGA